MANAQIKFLNKRAALKILLVNEILRVTTLQRGVLLSSYQISGLISPISVALLRVELKNYSGSGFAEPASHIGSLCAELAQRGLLMHRQKLCPVLKRKEDAFVA